MRGGSPFRVGIGLVGIGLAVTACSSSPTLAHAAGRPGKAGIYEVGEPAVESTTKTTIRVVDFDAGPVRNENPTFRPRPGYHLASARVEVCGGPDGPADIDPDRFQIQVGERDPIGQTLDARLPGLDVAGLAPNRCVQGWVTFQIETGTRPTFVLYSNGTAKAKWGVG